MMSKKDLISKAEEVADEVWRRSKTILPTIVRLCIVSTFIEEGIRMCFRWSEQRDYIVGIACGSMNGKCHCLSYGYASVIATLFVLGSICGQLVTSGHVLIRILVADSCAWLLYVVFVRIFVYPILWDLNFFLKNVSICGGLLLLLADCKVVQDTLFASLLSLDKNLPKAKTYLQLSGRILTVLTFATILHLDINFFQIIQNITAITLMVAVAIGFNTRLSALLLALWLTGLNFYFNCWTTDSHKPMHDFLKNDFFQTLSVIGSLLMIVLLGPGSISMDDYKKRCLTTESALIQTKTDANLIKVTVETRGRPLSSPRLRSALVCAQISNLN